MALRPGITKVNFLVKSKTEAKPVTKAMKLLFTFFHLVLGLDFGFIKFKTQSMRMLSTILTFVRTSAVLASLGHALVLNGHNGSIWYFFDALFYWLFAVLLLLSNTTYYDFQVDLHSFDKEIEVESSSYKVDLKMTLVFLLSYIFKVSLTITYSLFKMGVWFLSIPNQLAFIVAMSGMDAVLIANTFVFQCVLYRMRKFCSFVQNDSSDVVSCHYLYKNIADITEKTKKSFDLLFFLALVFNSIDVAAFVYLPFVDQMKQTNFSNMLMSYPFLACKLLLLFAPAVTAGLLSSQVEALKVALYDKLVKDQKSIKDIKRFISYIEARPLRFKVWKVIPLDWSLPVIVINIAVTYLIVMIQFTHD